MPTLTSAAKGSRISITKPNGRGVYRVTPVEYMKVPYSERMEEEYDDTGKKYFVPYNPCLQILVGSKQTRVPCSLECFTEALTEKYHKRTDARFFLYQRLKKQKAGKVIAEPVELISVVTNTNFIRGTSPTKASSYAMTLLVNAKDGSVVITGTHFRHKATESDNIASSVATMPTLKEGDAVAGSADLYIASIRPTETDNEYAVIIRSKDADKTEKEVATSGFLT